MQATIPVFLLIVLGFFLSRRGVLGAAFCTASDRLVFTLALPSMLLYDLSTTQIRETFDLSYLLFCAGVTTLIFFTLWGLFRRLLPDRSLLGEFVQLSYRSSAAILGCAVLRSIYGDVGMAPLMILGSVPLFNLYAVLVLSMEGPGREERALSERLRLACVNLLKNPIILSILLGMALSFFGLRAFPPILDRTLQSIAALATPLALLSIGGGFRFRSALAHRGTSALAAGIKLILLPALFLPPALFLGFDGAKLLALIIMLGSASTPACYIMAKNLGHEGALSASVIVLTTLGAAFTLTFWIFLVRQLGYV